MTSTDTPETVNFFYIKSAQFRVVHADGVIGGITPRGQIHLAFYSERGAIPQVQTHNVSPEGTVSEPIASEGKSGIVREIDFDAIMTKRAAIDFRDWLTRQISELEKYEKSEAK